MSDRAYREPTVLVRPSTLFSHLRVLTFGALASALALSIGLLGSTAVRDACSEHEHTWACRWLRRGPTFQDLGLSWDAQAALSELPTLVPLLLAIASGFALSRLRSRTVIVDGIGRRLIVRRSSPFARTRSERVPFEAILDVTVHARFGFASAVMIDGDGRVHRLTPFQIGRWRAERVVQGIATACEGAV
jgi:hypothetical protein